MIGIDEVGRGAWAGPLLVVAVRQKAELPAGLDDSKKLTKIKRNNLIASIKSACDIGQGWVQPDEIDELGLTKSMKLAVKRALLDLNASQIEEIIMDGHINYCHPSYVNVKCVVKADAKYPIVSAASIYAKVIRDNLMIDLAERFKNYGFESHVGYGTAKHVKALQDFGITKIHRLSYKPVRTFI